METIFDLPQTARNYIYTTILTSELTPHNTPDTLRENRKNLPHEGKEYGWKNHLNLNYYPLDSPPVNASFLLSINRQIRNEVSEVIRGMKSGKLLKYKIDCLIEGERNIYPTWLSLPVLTSEIDTLEVDLRLFGKRSAEERSGFLIGCRGCNGGPGLGVWSLAALLVRFLEKGPLFISSISRPMTVGTISINIISPPPSSALESAIVTDDEEEMWKFGPKMLGQMLAGEIENYLLKPSHTETRQMYKVMSGKLANMRVMVDGELVNQWKVPKIDELKPEYRKHFEEKQ